MPATHIRARKLVRMHGIGYGGGEENIIRSCRTCIYSSLFHFYCRENEEEKRTTIRGGGDDKNWAHTNK